MLRFSGRRIICGACILTGALSLGATGALAQQAPAQANNSNVDTATGLQEVVVTAQFRNENVQETPLAITAVNAETLAERGQTSLTQITQDSPSVQLNSTATAFGPSMSAYIRGIGQGDLDPALEPGVGIYIDDVYFGTLTGSLMDLLDLDRVEVLRGPQGTLEGMNSEGGAIKLFSKKPDANESMNFDALYGSRNHVELRASTNFALTDDLFVRVSGVGNHQDGYETLEDFGCANPNMTATDTAGVTGIYNVASGPLEHASNCVTGHEGGIGYAGGRVALRWQPSDSLEVMAIGDLMNEDQEVPAETLIYAGPDPLAGNASAAAAEGTTIPTTTPGAYLPFDQTKVPSIIPKNIYTAYTDFCLPGSMYVPTANAVVPAFGGTNAYCAQPRQTVDSWGGELSINWNINSATTLKNILSDRGYTSSWSEDNDASPWPLGLGIEGMDHHQLSEELRLNGSALSNLEYTVGAFYFRELTVYSGHEDLWYAVPTAPGLLNFIQDDPILAHDKAGYLHLTYHVTSKLDAIFGTRYTDQDKTYNYVRVFPGGGPAPIVGSLNGSSGEYKGSRWDWRGDLDYHITDDAMTYLQYSTGFKGGGVDPRPFYVEQVKPFASETLSTYESGLKTSWFDNHLHANVDVYFSQYRDIQLTLNDCIGVEGIPAAYGIPCALPFNAGDAHQKGVEFETQAKFGGLQFDANMSYLDFKYTYLGANTGITYDMVTPFTPEWQGAAGVQYAVPIGSAGSITGRIDGNFRSQIQASAVNSPNSTLGGYTVYNAHLTWAPVTTKWQVIVQVLNLTDKRYWINKFDLAQTGGASIAADPSPPLEVDLEIKHTM
jgi:iron complex outermembrane recepter protein